MTSPDNNKTAYEIAQKAKENMEQCECGRHYNPKFSDGDYCRTCMMEKRIENRSESTDNDH